MTTEVDYEALEIRTTALVRTNAPAIKINNGDAVCGSCGEVFPLYSAAPHSSVNCKSKQIRRHMAEQGMCLVSAVNAGTLHTLGYRYMLHDVGVAYGHTCVYVGLWVYACIKISTSLTSLANNLARADSSEQYRRDVIMELSLSLGNSYDDQFTRKAIDYMMG